MPMAMPAFSHVTILLTTFSLILSHLMDELRVHVVMIVTNLNFKNKINHKNQIKDFSLKNVVDLRENRMKIFQHIRRRKIGSKLQAPLKGN
jgi:hypothetical protein